MCKPQKIGMDNRWRPQDRALLEDAEREMQTASAIQPKTRLQNMLN